jgi:hypothetical protein
MVASGVKLNPGYGGTEFGSPTWAIPKKGDENEWAYMEFSERSNVRWVPQGDGTYECQFLVRHFFSLQFRFFMWGIRRLKHMLCLSKTFLTFEDMLQPIFGRDTLRKTISGKCTRFRVPSRLSLNKTSVGRIDDVVIHSSGEKTVPAPMEDIIMSSIQLVSRVL